MRRLYRDRWDKKIGGVCGGLGHFLGMDATVIRLLLVFLCIFTGVLPLLIAYFIAWILMPLGPTNYIQYDCKRLYRSLEGRKIAGICAGVAEALSIDPTIVRIVALVAMVLTGFFPVIIAYIVGAVIIPEKPL
ncbi:PspC domain-containing protein [Candidatus Neptunochlamydia vexilliferae]|uniref:Phage shock protein PspC N-terminal domain-containing protein n=1 Tax=Candidatus Neptunichlamydia vexilliferae TaxID=1651774 RepID=A0ABS0B0H7_9BACT|nr:PspC domain-containing protein [Candidatus Neptunochlamydia vexilliferae]MBF5059211.1 hypothetical protein [Candidatus Neptunochlamydia vexilliferae]